MPPSLHTLQNGMQVVLLRAPSHPVISYSFLAKVGSAFETDREAGIAHVIEHMLFKGTPTRPVGSIASTIEAAGGELNAYTSFDQTVYYSNMASRFADRGLDVWADALQHPLFDEDELRREIEVILEEIRREHDSPSRMVGEYLFQNAYKRHPYRRPIIGYPKTVKSFDRKILLNFYHRWYTPKNIATIVVGDFTEEIMLKKIDRAFASWKESEPPKPLADQLMESPQKGLRLSVHPMSVQSTYFTLGYHIPSITHADIPALDVLSHILGGSDSSRLEQEVKEKKRLVHRIQAYAYTPRSPGLLTIGGMLTDSKAPKALEAIADEIHRLQKNGITRAELENAKLNIRASEIYERETVGGVGGKLAYFLATAGSITFEDDYYRAIHSTTEQDVVRVAQGYLPITNCTAVFVSPEKTVWKKNAAPLCAALKQTKQKKRRQRSFVSPKIPEPLRLKNGVTLILEENHELPIVSVVAATLGGVRAETKSTLGISTLLAHTITKGTTTKTALQVAQHIERMAGNIDGISGRNTVGLKSEFLSDHLEAGCELFADVLTRPSFSAEEVEKEKHLQLQAIRDQEDNLSQIAFMNFLKELFPTHPYGFNGLGNESTVKRLQSAHLASAWKNMVRAKNLVISIVGDVRIDHMRKVAESVFSALPPGNPRFSGVTRDPAPKKIRRQEQKKKGKQQAHIVLGFQATRYTDTDTSAFTVLNHILSGQGGRLFLSLRDKMSLAYSVSSTLQVGVDPGYFAVYIGTEPKKVETAIDGMKHELEKLLDRPVTKEELSRSQQYLIGSFELDWQRRGTIASHYTFNHLYGLGTREVIEYPKKILAVTTKDIQRIAKRYINLDAYTLSIVTP